MNYGSNTSTNSSLLLAAFSRTEGVIWCSAFAAVSFFIVVGNVLALLIFALNKKLRKKSFLLVINMAFADLILGALSLPIYIYELGGSFGLWTTEWFFSLEMFHRIVDTLCAQASIITAAFIAGERFYATAWPLKHRSIARRRVYYKLIALVWVLSVAISSAVLAAFHISVYVSIHIWVPYAFTLTLVIVVCYIGIRKKYNEGKKLMRIHKQQPTKTLLIITFLVLVSWLPLILTNAISVYIPVNHNIILFVNLLNFSNSFANPVIYALRITDFRKALLNTARKIRKPSVSRLAAASTRVHLQVTFKHAIDLRTFRQQEKNRGDVEETETELRTPLTDTSFKL